MTRSDLRVLLEIPDYWTPEQALAVFELIDDLRERILFRYEEQIKDVLRDECAPSAPPEPSDGIGTSDGRRAPVAAIGAAAICAWRLQTPSRRRVAVVLAAGKERPGCGKQASPSTCQPSLPAAARVGCDLLRSGRK